MKHEILPMSYPLDQQEQHNACWISDLQALYCRFLVNTTNSSAQLLTMWIWHVFCRLICSISTSAFSLSRNSNETKHIYFQNGRKRTHDKREHAVKSGSCHMTVHIKAWPYQIDRLHFHSRMTYSTIMVWLPLIVHRGTLIFDCNKTINCVKS